MYHNRGGPPLPPGRPPPPPAGPAEFPKQEPLWQNGVQIWSFPGNALDKAALLKSVGTEQEAYEVLEFNRRKGTEAGMSTSVSSAENIASTSASAEALKDAPTKDSSSTVPSQVLACIQASSRDKTQAGGAALDLQNWINSSLIPLEGALGAPGAWEHAAAAARLRSKQDKIERNRKWRKRKRQRFAEARLKEREDFGEADRKIDEWRAGEIAKSIARSKMEKMKELAEKNAKADRARLAAEMEMVLLVEKLQELRALRIQKLKKQGRFFPDEDDKFLERVRAAVEEEERQTTAAADTRAVAVAIASASEAAKVTGEVIPARKADGDRPLENQPELTSDTALDGVFRNSADQNVADVSITSITAPSAREEKGTAAQEAYKLPTEFYHFYYGSQFDMGALIEVRRSWDAFLRPGGSRIPGHWIQAPPPSDAVWASCLVLPAVKMDTAGNSDPKKKKRKKVMK